MVDCSVEQMSDTLSALIRSDLIRAALFMGAERRPKFRKTGKNSLNSLNEAIEYHLKWENKLELL